MLNPLPGPHSLGAAVIWASQPGIEFELVSYTLESKSEGYSFTAVVRPKGSQPYPTHNISAVNYVWLVDLSWPE